MRESDIIPGAVVCDVFTGKTYGVTGVAWPKAMLHSAGEEPRELEIADMVFVFELLTPNEHDTYRFPDGSVIAPVGSKWKAWWPSTTGNSLGVPLRGCGPDGMECDWYFDSFDEALGALTK